MIRAAETFRLLAASIAEAGAPTASDRLGDRVTRASDRWPELLTLAHKFYVGPELFHALERKGLLVCVPEEARELLAMTHALNVKRNQAIRDQCLEALGVLDGQGIPTVMLKGGAWLFETPPDQLGRRMMRDLDILVPRAELEAAVAALENLGYATIVDWPDWVTYQYPPMGRPDDPAAVELHRDVGEQRTLLRAEEAFASAVALDGGGSGVAALSPTLRALHNVFNSEIQDRHHAFGVASLFQLHDLRLIVERHGAAIDWDWIAARMDAHGYGRAFDCYLYLLNALLGVALPYSPRDPARCRRHYSRCLAKIGWRPLMVAAVLWGTLSHPLKRLRVDYMYGGRNHAERGQRSVRRIRRLLARYGWGAFRKFAKIYRHYDSEW